MELSGYLAVARRWWWTLLVATWVAAVSGYVVASQIPPTYESRVQLLVGPYNTDSDTLRAAGQLVQTYAELVTTQPLLESAIAEVSADIDVGNLDAGDLDSATRVTADETTRFLAIRVQDTVPERAAALANGLAEEISLLASRGTSRPEGQLPISFAYPSPKRRDPSYQPEPGPKVISTRRFCGSRTPSAVSTSGRLSPNASVDIAVRGTPRPSR